MADHKQEAHEASIRKHHELKAMAQEFLEARKAVPTGHSCAEEIAANKARALEAAVLRRPIGKTGTGRSSSASATPRPSVRSSASPMMRSRLSTRWAPSSAGA